MPNLYVCCLTYYYVCATLNSCVFENIKFFDNAIYTRCHAHCVAYFSRFSLFFFCGSCRVPFYHKILMSIFAELKTAQPHYPSCATCTHIKLHIFQVNNILCRFRSKHNQRTKLYLDSILFCFFVELAMIKITELHEQ